MINPSFKELERINNSRYAVCVIASKRARKIIDGSKPLAKNKTKNPVTTALTEIMEGKVTYEKDIKDE
ncbi:MAG: DNA-directed RNA polymerase subunit omega [Lagierella massiliensis]|nr:DNA-directed RNA polymerase subunit omega [Lagierella massiliensis]